MSSEVDIVNLAVSRLGSASRITSLSPPDGSAVAASASVFYPMLRDALIEMGSWSFSIRRRSLALLSSVEAPHPFGFAYAYPSDCMAVIDVRPAGGSDDDDPAKSRIETLLTGERVIYTDAENAVLRYKVQVVDTTRFPPLFVDALSWLLAANLTGPVMGGDSRLTQWCYQMFSVTLASASGSSAGGDNFQQTHTPDWIKAR